MDKKGFFLYIIAAICILSIIIIPLFFPALKNNDSLMLMMQGLNILVFLHISYKLSTEDKNKYINQQKFDNERLHRQLKFDLVKKYVDEFDKYLKEIQNIKEFLHLGQYYSQEKSKFEVLIQRFSTENLKLINILSSLEYDSYLFIQSNLIEQYYKFSALIQELDVEKKYTKDDPEILEVDEYYINTLSHLSLLTDYLYYILLNDAEEYELEEKLKISENAFNKLKLKNIE
ncbi:hypothetical protein [Prolixibacter sp. NT017]|uniref:hypothetical protein n=1 Tax=Prolixibacter sp. NT017 TaxID=2652390 RepID=UPI001277FF82|nr:hypothetical protein [Prolixibacter sp. NT017]GET25889.1 hypothetical protein NT017_22180 [Prolixibacter sp. NT017]